MSVLLITSSVVTTALIPPRSSNQPATHESGKPWTGPGLSRPYYLGDVFGTLYDLSTILFCGLPAPRHGGSVEYRARYLPRYGMAPEWARATRPLVLVFTAICFAVTIIFEADVDAQGGAYATGVLVLMSSAAMAVTLQVWRGRNSRVFL